MIFSTFAVLRTDFWNYLQRMYVVRVSEYTHESILRILLIMRGIVLIITVEIDI